jgi:hypothetical protein
MLCLENSHARLLEKVVMVVHLRTLMIIVFAVHAFFGEAKGMFGK